MRAPLVREDLLGGRRPPLPPGRREDLAPEFPMGVFPSTAVLEQVLPGLPDATFARGATPTAVVTAPIADPFEVRTNRRMSGVGLVEPPRRALVCHGWGQIYPLLPARLVYRWANPLPRPDQGFRPLPLRYPPLELGERRR